jgi:AAHS family 4-hydroxybenzoate transporter-like MFS transporter
MLLWIALPESPALKREQVYEKAGKVSQLFAPGMRSQTLAIWLSFALVLMVTYLLNGWIPLVVKEQGFSTATATWIATAGHAGGVVGGIFVSLALSRKQWPVVAIFAATAALVMLLLASRTWGGSALAALVALQGFFSVGTQNGLNGSASAHYSARMRSLGLGWALGIGRIGSILGPFVGSAAALLGVGTPHHFFYLPVLPLLIAALLAWYLSHATRAQNQRPAGQMLQGE